MHRNLFVRIITILLWLLVLGENARTDGQAQPTSPKRVANVFAPEGIPFHRSFGAKDTGGTGVFRAMVQDRRGIVYAASTDGVYEFDGESWRLIRVNQASSVLSLAVNRNGTVFVGGAGDFGFLAPDAGGTTRFISLARLADRNLLSNAIFSVHASSQGVFFRTYGFLYRWRDNRLTTWKTTKSSNEAFLVNDCIYVWDDMAGLRKIRGDQLCDAPFGNRFVGNKVVFMLPFPSSRGAPETILIGTVSGMYLLSENSLREFRPNAMSPDDLQSLTHAIALPGGFAVSTKASGLVVMTPEGNPITRLNRSNGLTDMEIHGIWAEGDQAIWVFTQNGLSRIETPSPLSYFDATCGLNGRPRHVCLHAGRLYISGFSGLSIMEPVGGSNPNRSGAAAVARVNPLPDINWRVNGLLSWEGTLLSASERGILQI